MSHDLIVVSADGTARYSFYSVVGSPTSAAISLTDKLKVNRLGFKSYSAQ
jgi:hypothetical protein